MYTYLSSRLNAKFPVHTQKVGATYGADLASVLLSFCFRQLFVTSLPHYKAYSADSFRLETPLSSVAFSHVSGGIPTRKFKNPRNFAAHP
jgi:hypothetical protein